MNLEIAQEEILVLERCIKEVGNVLIAEQQSLNFLLSLQETDLSTVENVTPNEDLNEDLKDTRR
jgi:hypothetical protein